MPGVRDLIGVKSGLNKKRAASKKLAALCFEARHYRAGMLVRTFFGPSMDVSY